MREMEKVDSEKTWTTVRNQEKKATKKTTGNYGDSERRTVPK
jgi:hypothetical protein